MKKVIFTLAIVCFAAMYSQAQFKPESGSITTEMSITPFSITNSPMGMIDGLKVRFFITDKLSVKLNLNYSSDTRKLEDDAGNKNNPILSEKTKTNDFSIMPGIEYHFGSMERLSPYAGFNVGLGLGSTKIDVENVNYSSGDWQKSKTKNMTFRIGLVTGFDFYVYEGLYVGTELGFGFRTEFDRQSSIEWDRTGMLPGDKGSETMDYPKHTDSSIEFAPTTAIRLGWRF